MAANIDSFTFTGLEVPGITRFEMSKARGDLLLPIRTVEEVRNVRCATFQRAPGDYSGSIAVFFVLAIEIAMRVPNTMKARGGLFLGDNSWGEIGLRFPDQNSIPRRVSGRALRGLSDSFSLYPKG